MLYWIGSITGIFGAFLLSFNIAFSGFGYIFMFISSIILTSCFYRDNILSMLFQQVIFLIINLIGVYSWVF